MKLNILSTTVDLATNAEQPTHIDDESQNPEPNLPINSTSEKHSKPQHESNLPKIDSSYEKFAEIE